jgi:DNA-binding SARP family transcriptional activator
MELRLLGMVSASHDGSRVDLPTGRATTLLAVLALHPDTAVSRERLIAAAWGAVTPATVMTQVHGLVSALRRKLPTGTIQTRGCGYQLCLTRESIDAFVFEHHVRQGRYAAAAGRSSSAAESFQAALDSWSGPALDGVKSAYLVGEANRLEALRRSALRGYAHAQLALRRYGQVAEDLLAPALGDPLDEDLCGLLMRALRGCGRRAEALAVFQRTRRAMAEDLGIQPGPELHELCRDTLRGVLTPTG